MKKWYKNLLIAGAVTLGIVIVVSFMLDWFTRNGREIEMGSVLGMTDKEVEKYIDDNNFDVVVLDSVFTDEYPKGTVCRQEPADGDMVKKGRKIYVSYVARQQEMVEMSNLDDLTVRQAVAVIFAKGLVVGKLVYQDGFDRNAIQIAKCGGKRVYAGREISKGSAIDLYVSRGVNTESVAVPRVLGMAIKNAMLNLFSLGFNVTRVNYDKACEGVGERVVGVYRQQPVGGYLQLGSSVELWVKPIESISSSELHVRYEEIVVTDSLSVDDEL